MKLSLANGNYSHIDSDTILFELTNEIILLLNKK